MKKFLRYIPAFLIAAAGAIGFTACQDDFDDHIPSMDIPSTDLEANISILDFKQLSWVVVDKEGNPILDEQGNTKTDSYWRDGDDNINYCIPIGTMPGTDGEHIIIKGRVISSDADGNVFKSLIIQDETAALAFSINRYDLYLEYRVGQEIVVDLTGMYCGKYRGLFQIGLPSYDENRGIDVTSFMPIDVFTAHAHLNGLPEPDKINIIKMPNFSAITNKTVTDQQLYQSQLIEFENVYFPAADGEVRFSAYKSSGEDRELCDANSATLNVRTSGYSTFWNYPLPKGVGNVTAICSYYGNNTNNAIWQLVIPSYSDVQFKANSGASPEEALSVSDVIDLENGGALDRSGWVTGYIVGAVKPEVEGSVTSSDQIDWSATPEMDNTIVIAEDPTVRDINKCLIVPLPISSAARRTINLVDNPDNYGKQIWLKASFEKYLNTWAARISGQADDFILEGSGEISDVITVAQAIDDYTAGSMLSVTVKGYIVGFIARTDASTAVFGINGAVATNILLADSPDCTDTANCICVKLEAGVNREALNLKDNPENLGKMLTISGTIGEFRKMAGLVDASDHFTLE